MPKNKGSPNIIYVSKTIYVDKQTGELLTKQQVKKYYKITNKYQYATSKYYGRYTRKDITITIECELRTYQGAIWD